MNMTFESICYYFCFFYSLRFIKRLSYMVLLYKVVVVFLPLLKWKTLAFIKSFLDFVLNHIKEPEI